MTKGEKIKALMEIEISRVTTIMKITAGHPEIYSLISDVINDMCDIRKHLIMAVPIRGKNETKGDFLLPPGIKDEEIIVINGFEEIIKK